jgi:hypothetical protein
VEENGGLDALSCNPVDSLDISQGDIWKLQFADLSLGDIVIYLEKGLLPHKLLHQKTKQH